MCVKAAGLRRGQVPVAQRTQQQCPHWFPEGLWVLGGALREGTAGNIENPHYHCGRQGACKGPRMFSALNGEPVRLFHVIPSVSKLGPAGRHVRVPLHLNTSLGSKHLCAELQDDPSISQTAPGTPAWKDLFPSQEQELWNNQWLETSSS